MKVGDLIKLEYGEPALGLVVEVLQRSSLRTIKIKWTDDGSYSVEKERDLVVINESR